MAQPLLLLRSALSSSREKEGGGAKGESRKQEGRRVKEGNEEGRIEKERKERKEEGGRKVLVCSKQAY